MWIFERFLSLNKLIIVDKIFKNDRYFPPVIYSEFVRNRIRCRTLHFSSSEFLSFPNSLVMSLSVLSSFRNFPVPSSTFSSSISCIFSLFLPFSISFFSLSLNIFNNHSLQPSFLYFPGETFICHFSYIFHSVISQKMSKLCHKLFISRLLLFLMILCYNHAERRTKLKNPQPNILRTANTLFP